jgi:hypothetical protein
MGKSSLVERSFAETTRKRIQRGVFKSVDELKHIMDYLDNHQALRLDQAKQASESLH